MAKHDVIAFGGHVEVLTYPWRQASLLRLLSKRDPPTQIAEVWRALAIVVLVVSLPTSPDALPVAAVPERGAGA